MSNKLDLQRNTVDNNLNAGACVRVLRNKQLLSEPPTVRIILLKRPINRKLNQLINSKDDIK